MPEWLSQIVIAVIGAGGLSGVGWFFKTRREDYKEERKRLIDKIDLLQTKVESLLMDASARERETIAQLTERIEMDKKQNEVIAAAVTTLREGSQVIINATTALQKVSGLLDKQQ